MAKYEWRDTGPRPKISADDFGSVVESLERKHGVAKAEDIVDAARNPKSPIHDAFPWNDAEAAEEHRKAIARRLTASLQIVRVETETLQATSTRAFHVARPDEKRGYVSEDRVRSSNDLLRQVVKQAERDLVAMIKRFRNVAELGKYVPRLQELVDGMIEDAEAASYAATRRQAPARRPEEADDDQRPSV